MTEAATLLRPGLLEGQAVAVLAAGEPGGAAAAACAEMGAEVTRLETVRPDALGGRLDTLVIDAASLFAAAPQEGLTPLRACADTAWEAARAAGTGAMIEAEGGGKIVVIAPDPDAGPHARGARAALENFARTLSIEWARYDIRVSTIHPAPTTDPADVAALVAYLASPAGDYFSGCLFTLA
jgi:NAD(P)-dependent dehydrogenase (short-subunit alcohol dehydrogenase family)